MIVDVEWARRRSTKLQKLIRTTCFRYPNSCMEDIEYHPARKLNKPQLYSYQRTGISVMDTVSYWEGHQVRKDLLVCALGVAACRNFMTVRYIRLSELLNDLVVACGEGTYKSLPNIKR